MTKLIDSSTTTTKSRDAAFFQMIGELDTAIDARQRRALEWARCTERLRSIGYRITIGSPI